jgi:hypothetical protein
VLILRQWYISGVRAKIMFSQCFWESDIQTRKKKENNKTLFFGGGKKRTDFYIDENISASN